MIPLGLVFGATVGSVHLPLTQCSTDLTRSIVTAIMMAEGFRVIRARCSRDNNELPRCTGTTSRNVISPDPFESEVKGRHAGFGS